MFPYTRLRRLRKFSWLRDLVSECNLSTDDLILPIFIKSGKNIKEPIKSMPGVYRLSIDECEKLVAEAAGLGIKAIALFPSVDDELKSEDGAEGYNQDNLVCRCIRHLKKCEFNIGIIADVALDPYTTHGHDGIFENGIVDNDKTIEALKLQALALAKSGVDIIAPSDMMDGRIGAIREFLEENNFPDITIISYAAKFASFFYSPFRDAVGSLSNLGKSDKKTYQMDYRNIRESIREVELDISEGADIIMIKPAMIYSDIIKDISSRFDIPVFAYQVSGEYSMLKNGAENNLFNFEDVIIETLTSIKRAGATAIFTYAAIDAAKILKNRVDQNGK